LQQTGKVEGHAVEVRLYAEDPRTFLPQAGKIEQLTIPCNSLLQGGLGEVRVDAGVEEGDEVGLSYDPMIAKLVAHGSDRREALTILAAALDETEVGGITTNLPFLRWLVSHPVVRAGEATTAFHRASAALTLPTPRGSRPGRAPGELNLLAAADGASRRRSESHSPRSGAR
jgi:acetyl/propionyl-CoA carboxylase alpha subunit